MGQKKRTLMGFCQDVEVITGEKWVANLFGQHGVGTNEVQTEVPFLRKAMESMKEKARERGLTVASWWGLSRGFYDDPRSIFRLSGDNLLSAGQKDTSL
jgi:hypothetical protein